MIRIIPCVFIIIVFFQLVTGVFLVSGTPGRKLSTFRTLLSALTILAGASIYWGLIALRRFGAKSGMSAFMDRLRGNGMIYQDVEYMALALTLGAVILTGVSLCLRALIFDGQPGFSRYQELYPLYSASVAYVFMGGLPKCRSCQGAA